MNLGIFSLSLNVKDIAASKAFYENLGFTPLEGAGSLADKWMILVKDEVKIGLFQEMFPQNILTFNPGWDANAQALDAFDDVRSIQQHLKAQGVKIENEVDENTQGPASFMIVDPDGNTILIDQHV